jgi:hypothetical protein
MTPLLTKRWKYVTGPIFIYYVIQFIFCVAGCNFYSDVTRKDVCTLEDGSTLVGEEASAVYDTAILLATIFHIIEWVRTTVLLCVTMLGADFLMVWYASAFNFILGLVAFIAVHLAYASEQGQACKANQANRYSWLMWEIIFFWVLFFYFQFPMIIYRLCKKERLSSIIEEEDEEED